MKKYRLTAKGRQAITEAGKRLLTWVALVLLGFLLAVVGLTLINEASEQNARTTQSQIQKIKYIEAMGSQDERLTLRASHHN